VKSTNCKYPKKLEASHLFKIKEQEKISKLCSPIRLYFPISYEANLLNGTYTPKAAPISCFMLPTNAATQTEAQN
jgi:hypothetical protein